MQLTIGNVLVSDIQFGDSTRVEEGVLYINSEELLAHLASSRLEGITVDLVRPGESVRIVPVKDVIEPRVKVSGPGGMFPGFVSDVTVVGTGRTHVLKGTAVVTTGKVVGFQEGIVDMTGPGAEYTPFSKTLNIVITANPRVGLTQHQHESALRTLGLKAATYLGEAARNVTPDEIRIYKLPRLGTPIENGLPKVGYVYMLQTQGLLHDSYYYGVDVKRIVPTLMYPTEVMDGAVVSGNCVSACDKNTTYHHQNNPVIHDLLERDGKDLNFLGCVVTNENVTLMDKQRSSNLTAKLVEYLGFDGVIISAEGFGNPDTDLMMNCSKIEQKGIKTVCITDEYAGRDGLSQSLADATKEADAVVTGGNANAVITLPPLSRIIGDVNPVDYIAGGFAGSVKEDGSITVELQAITGATNELGFNRMTAREY